MVQDISNDVNFHVSQEFIESGKHTQSKKKRGGPYSKDEKIKRQNEVYRLHFEYGYSARKISDMMSINRNTINGDINYWYGKVINNSNYLEPETEIIINIQRLNIQRSRLRERLDKVENFQQRHAIEKMIFDIDCKIISIKMRVAESMKRIQKLGVHYLNDWLKENKKDERFMTFSDKIAVSEKAQQKISKIIKEDKIRSSF